MKSTRIAIMASALALTLGACSSRQNGWSVEGTATADSTIIIEGYNNGRWYTVDTLTAGSDGRFLYRAQAPASYPEIMRLRGSALPAPVFFPANENEAVTIVDGRASGSLLAEGIARIDSIVAAAVDRLGTAAAADRELQRAIASAAIADTTSIVAYYALNKSVGGRPLFPANEEFGNRIYGAVAQNFATNRPDDPRGAMIRAVYLEGRKALGRFVQIPDSSAIAVNTSGVIDIKRYDSRGKEHSLAEITGKGKPVVLSFTLYGSDFSPSYNRLLNEAWEKYHDRGMEIYQLGFDADEVAWKESTLPLPWICVYNSPSDGIQPLAAYNVGSLPATFIIDRNGDIRERVLDPADLPALLEKYVGR